MIPPTPPQGDQESQLLEECRLAREAILWAHPANVSPEEMVIAGRHFSNCSACQHYRNVALLARQYVILPPPVVFHPLPPSTPPLGPGGRKAVKFLIAFLLLGGMVFLLPIFFSIR